MNFAEQNLSLEKCPTLVLNADYRPLVIIHYHYGVGEFSKISFFR